MRILLDNCVNHRFAKLFSEWDVVHVRQLGWQELTNGKLLAAAEESGFDVLLTVDQNVRMQQTMKGRKLSLITLAALSITLEGLTPFVASVESAVRRLKDENTTGEDILLQYPAQKA